MHPNLHGLSSTKDFHSLCRYDVRLGIHGKLDHFFKLGHYPTTEANRLPLLAGVSLQAKEKVS
jgi:hypothetical protein